MELPELHAAVREFWSTRFALAGELVRRGVERGELPAGTDADLLIEALIAPLYLRLLVTAEPLDAGHARRVVDLVVDGARGDGEGRPIHDPRRSVDEPADHASDSRKRRYRRLEAAN